MFSFNISRDLPTNISLTKFLEPLRLPRAELVLKVRFGTGVPSHFLNVPLCYPMPTPTPPHPALHIALRFQESSVPSQITIDLKFLTFGTARGFSTAVFHSHASSTTPATSNKDNTFLRDLGGGEGMAFVLNEKGERIDSFRNPGCFPSLPSIYRTKTCPSDSGQKIEYFSVR